MNVKQYKTKVAAMACRKCGAMPVELHHVRSGCGMGQRASDWLVIPLCPECHRTGKDSIHNRNVDEMKYLASTIQEIMK